MFEEKLENCGIRKEAESYFYNNIIEKYIQNCTEVSYTATSDRGTVSQINKMIMASEHRMVKDKLDGIETDIYELNRWLNRYIMMKLPKLYAGKLCLKNC